MKFEGKKIKFADASETACRWREVQLLVNVVEPDPEYQPLFLSDEASFLDITGHDQELVTARLEFYLKRSLPAPLSTPIWKFVDIIKGIHPEWPESGPDTH